MEMYHASIFKLRFNEELLNVKNELNQGCRIKSYTRISIKQMFDSVYIYRDTAFSLFTAVLIKCYIWKIGLTFIIYFLFVIFITLNL